MMEDKYSSIDVHTMKYKESNISHMNTCHMQKQHHKIADMTNDENSKPV